ncbi:hypothetical protein EYZ11_001409 [Aspergillus tanneri]|uniref:Uncharacterized protein n=1 Tax=Aspergillus tanneri TaxID=1220188 RepID=A0A4S3JUL8_9EURO|nr:uncharacterized protein ATNIH1004_010224 [Aspergillus tanneri]KAA8643455.1 hypothetical protein ATNIH1004_010224 [Aspergillus tanneri]THC99088.1 hypothetical protein EYZ11_001409 [Aspergillus tanneri]
MPPSPFTATLIQSTILNAISNLLAQVIDQHKKNRPFSLNTLALLQFVTYAILILPINFSWQNYLEAWYPGFPSWKKKKKRGTTSDAEKRDGDDLNLDLDPDIDLDLLPVKEKPAWLQPAARNKTRRSGLWNFSMKFLLDQTVGSVVNIVLFVVLINLLKGMGWTRSWELVWEDFTPIMIARLKYRPVVSTLLFTVVPVERRVVFGSACGVVWSIYLSLYAAV